MKISVYVTITIQEKEAINLKMEVYGRSGMEGSSEGLEGGREEGSNVTLFQLKSS